MENQIIWLLIGMIVSGMMTLTYMLLEQRQKKPFTLSLEKRAEVYEIMNRVMQHTAVKRFLILKAENGGGRPAIDAKLYISTIYEDFRHPFTSVKTKYQRVITDAELNKLLITISREGHKNIETKMLQRSLLKTIYETDGVAFAQVFYLTETDRHFVYCSIATDEKGALEMADMRQQLFIQLEINRLQDFLNKITKKHTTSWRK